MANFFPHSFGSWRAVIRQTSKFQACLLAGIAALLLILQPVHAVSTGEQAALDALYESTGGDNGPLGGAGTNWGEGDPCDNDWLGVECNGSGSVIRLRLANNGLEGELPDQLGNLTSLTELRLDGNAFTGSLPATLAQLDNLAILFLSDNALDGAIPSNYIALADNLTELDIRYNRLEPTSDATLDSALDAAQIPENGGNWSATQTVVPTNILVAESGLDSFTLQWSPIEYRDDSGGYELIYGTDENLTENNSTSVMTADKSSSEFMVSGLNSGTRYYVAIRTVTVNPGGKVGVNLLSDFSSPIMIDTLRDTDGDGIPDNEDPDDDNDGIPDDEEPGNGGETDTDGDGVPDSQEPDDVDVDGDGNPNVNDPDDDGDGIPTDEELGPGGAGAPADSDGDGIPDYLDPDSDSSDGINDSDGDGLFDPTECPNAPDCADTDGDGRPNYNDPDDDNDGIPTSEEGIIDSETGEDTDGDGVMDAMEPNDVDTDGDGNTNEQDADDDGDGINTVDEVGSGGPWHPDDADGDNIPDYLDADSNNAAGTADGSGDSDNDGLSDMEECPNAPDCPDLDGDGIPAYMDDTELTAINPDTNLAGPVITGLDGVADGGGASGLGYFLMLLMAWMQRRRIAGVRLPLMVSLIVLACTLPGAAIAKEKQVYFGIGGGVSTLNPDDNRAPENTSDERSGSYKLLLGYDVTDHWSVEAFWSDLGTVEFEPAGEIDYRMFGVSGQFYYPGSLPGLSGFLKAGVASLSVDGRDIEYVQDNETQVYAGAGAEFQFSKGFSVRGEYEYYTEDSQLASVSLIKRFDIKEREREPIVETKVVEKTVMVPGPSSIITHEAGPQDSDKDGVTDDMDDCPGTPQGITVNERGCPEYIGVLDGVHFHTAKATLTREAMKILDGVAEKMRGYPSLKVTVVGHTDSRGTNEYNMDLSINRAKSVASYLASKGVASDRMRYAGFGEERPRADNGTAEGMALNRRVELVPRKE